MNPVVIKLVPSAVVLAVGGYVVWPYVDTAAPPLPAAPAAAVEVPPSSLWPELAAPPARDPFEDAEAVRAEARAGIKSTIRDLTKRAAEARRRADARRAELAAASRGGKPAGARPGAVAVVDPLDGLTLNATYAQGGGGVAVINGRIYKPGQPLDPAPAEVVRVLSEVRPHSVVIRLQGQQFELRFREGRQAVGPGPAKGRSAPVRRTVKG